jgi:hypothetical protein
MSTANSLALDARLIIEETLNKNGGLFVESGRTHFEYLIFRLRMSRLTDKSAIRTSQNYKFG